MLTSTILIANDAVKDPYQSMSYTVAFNQKALHKKYQSLMEQLGCAHNVFSGEYPSRHTYGNDNTAAPVDPTTLAAYQCDCIQQLNAARQAALAEPGVYALLEMILTNAGAQIAARVTGKDSAGGSYFMASAITESLKLLPRTFKSIYDLMSWPDNYLQALETRFALNQCYIPHVLWPRISNKFIAARNNAFERDKHLQFLEFVLGFTIYEPRPAINFAHNMNADDIMYELDHRIDAFFNNYQVNNHAHDREYIKLNVAKFIDCLVDPCAPVPRYIYLYGSGGIGKTHFVHALSSWIEELVQNSVHFESPIVNSVDELEGSMERAPGVFLRILRNQLMHKKRGSIVIFDEATWFNEAAMISAAKRVFNNDQSRVSTKYFGEEEPGKTISLPMPPMLIFVASNTAIEDPALKTRFDVVHYPSPTKEALVHEATNVALTSARLRRKEIDLAPQAIPAWIDELNPSDLNFRYVKANVEAYLCMQVRKAYKPTVDAPGS